MRACVQGKPDPETGRQWQTLIPSSSRRLRRPEFQKALLTRSPMANVARTVVLSVCCISAAHGLVVGAAAPLHANPLQSMHDQPLSM